ncbi:MAG TPA: sugar ABC transporter permease, partial [Anaeromyxobacteraceae bacterium]
MAAPSHRRRFLAGLALALALGAGGSWLLLRAAARQAAEEAATRRAVVALLALDDLVARAGLRGERVRALVAAWQARQPPGVEVRVLLFQGVSLEASTAPADTGERAAPRRLAREEKPLFDQGQRLRAAVAGNAAGESRKPEIEVEPLPGGGRVLAAPLRDGGQVAGLLRATFPPAPAPRLPGPLAPALAAGLPLLAFWLASRALGERRWRLAAAAAACLLAGMALLGREALRAVEGAHSAAQASLAAEVQARSAEAAALIAS